MALYTVHQDVYGPDWPLGFIEVLVPGTPVQLTSLVDASNDDAPETANSFREYTSTCNHILLQAMKPLPPPKGHGCVPNLGNVYITRAGGNRDDYGTIIAVIPSGQNHVIPSSDFSVDVLSPYRYYVDADNAGDGVQVTLMIF